MQRRDIAACDDDERFRWNRGQAVFERQALPVYSVYVDCQSSNLTHTTAMGLLISRAPSILDLVLALSSIVQPSLHAADSAEQFRLQKLSLKKTFLLSVHQMVLI